MDVIPVAVDEFAAKYTSPETDVLRRLNRETNLKVEQPQMLSGHVQGRYLSMISQLIQPRRILEIGTYTGYSAICLAQGLTSDGLLYTLDVNEEREEMCRRYFREAGLEQKIRPMIGKAAVIIPQLQEVFDLVFIDADKTGYEQYYDLVWERLRPGGVILADNVLYHGEVLLEEDQQSTNAKAMVRFCKKVAADGRAEQIVLTMRDGLLMIRKNTH